jgi:hypothetical protein
MAGGSDWSGGLGGTGLEADGVLTLALNHLGLEESSCVSAANMVILHYSKRKVVDG